MLNDRIAAAQLAAVLLVVVAGLLMAERTAQHRMRFAASRGGAVQSAEARPLVLRGGGAVLAWVLCTLPVLLGFVLPVAWLLQMVWQEAAHSEFGLPLARFAAWAWSSFQLAGLAAVAATGLALALGFALRQRRGGLLQPAARVLSLGYAIPGAVIAVGILLPVAWLQERWPPASPGRRARSS